MQIGSGQPVRGPTFPRAVDPSLKYELAILTSQGERYEPESSRR